MQIPGEEPTTAQVAPAGSGDSPVADEASLNEL
jgi:hypothetical protein